MIILDNQARQQMTLHFQLSLQCNVSPITGFVRHTAKKKKKKSGNLYEDKLQHGLGGSTRSGQVKQVEGEEDQGECVHQDQENVQHGFRVFPESSLELPN